MVVNLKDDAEALSAEIEAKLSDSIKFLLKRKQHERDERSNTFSV